MREQHYNPAKLTPEALFPRNDQMVNNITAIVARQIVTLAGAGAGRYRSRRTNSNGCCPFSWQHAKVPAVENIMETGSLVAGRNMWPKAVTPMSVSWLKTGWPEAPERRRPSFCCCPFSWQHAKVPAVGNIMETGSLVAGRNMWPKAVTPMSVSWLKTGWPEAPERRRPSFSCQHHQPDSMSRSAP